MRVVIALGRERATQRGANGRACRDRNDYYGGASASLNLEQLFAKYKDGKKPPETLGRARDYNVDIVPKFIMVRCWFVWRFLVGSLAS